MELHLRCTSCRRVIGLYEPTVIVDELCAHLTSAGGRTDIELPPGNGCYHRSCYSAEDQQPSGEP